MNRQIVLNTPPPPPKKYLLKMSHPKNTCQIFLPKKNPESKILQPKKHSIIPSLEIRSIPRAFAKVWSRDQLSL